MTRELRLLFACTKVLTTQEDQAAIRQMLDEGIDWTLFAQKAIDQGLISLAGHTLVRVAPDIVPDDILNALRIIIDGTRARNRELFDALARMIEASPSKDAVVAIQKACAAANGALAANPTDAEAWRTLGLTLSDLNRRKEAILCYDRAVALTPNNAASWTDYAAAMHGIGQSKTALTYIDKALELDPQDDRTWTLRAEALSMLRRFAEAAEASDRALTLSPNNTAAARVGIHSRLLICDWSNREDLKWKITEGVKAGLPIITPFNHQAIFDSEAQNLTVARLWAKTFSRSPGPLWRGEHYRHDKIRIAYVSTDFFDTMAVNAIAGCFEEHDKSRFEITAISMGPSDGSETRRRIESAVDRFVDVQAMEDSKVATMLRELEIDIAIDVNGYSGNKRTEIFACRPAPIQVNYLGFPGTMGAPFIDYIIADRMVIPEENQIHYGEQAVYLPHTYFPTDRKRQIADETPTRADAGLPEDGFVFTCHNTAYKITPEMFDLWMRLLRTVDKSVLWLSSRIPSATENLRREAEARGVAPERIVFAPRIPERAGHLARFRLADLFLDTQPYNAHTTACDALWAGLPVLTCPANTFPGRVAASLLHAIGLPELVTASLVGYEELARTLAQDSERLAAIKSKLMRNRDTEPLFDTTRFTRYLESAYAAMWERQQAGLPPASFAVAS